MIGYCTFDQKPQHADCTVYPLTKEVRCEFYSIGQMIIVLRTRERAVILNHLFPGGHFLPGTAYLYNAYNSEIRYVPHDLAINPQEVVSILHEIAHARICSRKGWFYRFLTTRAHNVLGDWFAWARHWALRDERRAWAETFRLVRRIRKEGINLFSLFDSADTLSRMIRTPALGSYELWLLELAGDGHPYIRRAMRKKYS